MCRALSTPGGREAMLMPATAGALEVSIFVDTRLIFPKGSAHACGERDRGSVELCRHMEAFSVRTCRR